jgi:hypothetical protein
MDDRFSGTDLGREKTLHCTCRMGGSTSTRRSTGFWPRWRERQALEASHLQERATVYG